MSVNRINAFMKKWGRDHDIIETQTSTATVAQAAAALGVESGRIAKSITLRNDRGSGLMVVASGDVKVNNRKFKQCFKFSPRMLSSAEAQTLTGFVIGGVCPFDLPVDVKVYLDKSLLRYDLVYTACGTSNSMIGLSCDDLYEYSMCIDWVDVCM